MGSNSFQLLDFSLRGFDFPCGTVGDGIVGDFDSIGDGKCTVTYGTGGDSDILRLT